jgi:hypothetical protein
VKDGVRPPAKPEEPVDSAEPGDLGDAAEPDGARAAPAPAAPAALSPGWLVADESVFNERANQLLVAAIACLTAWRPVSSMPLPGPALSPPGSSSGFSPAFSAAGPALGTARKPAPGVFERFRLLISSAGNGTRTWPDAAASPSAPEAGLPAPAGLGTSDDGEEASAASVTASSGTGSAPLLLAAALAADRDVPDADDADRDVPDRARDEDMVPLSSIVSAVSASGSTSWPDGATITDGSVARPASSTPSSSVPNGAPFVPLAEIT